MSATESGKSNDDPVKDEPAKHSSRRTRAPKSATSKQVTDQNDQTDQQVDQPGDVEKTMTEQEKTTDKATKTTGKSADTKESKGSEVTALSLKDTPKEEKGGIELSSIWNRPVGPGPIDIAETISVAGVRPIASSNMEVFGTILNNRPIMASNVRVAEADALADRRPIFSSELVVRDDLTLPGGRPIMASDPHLLQATLLPGGRPIASNEMPETEELMGYID
jgi:hypothetical protein